MGTGSGDKCGSGQGCLDAAAGGGECACGDASGPAGPGFSAHGYLSAMNGMVGLSCGHQRGAGATGVNAGTFDGFQMPLGLTAQPEGRAAHFGGDPRDTVRLGSPGEVAAAIPHFFGFQPIAARSML